MCRVLWSFSPRSYRDMNEKQFLSSWKYTFLHANWGLRAENRWSLLHTMIYAICTYEKRSEHEDSERAQEIPHRKWRNARFPLFIEQRNYLCLLHGLNSSKNLLNEHSVYYTNTCGLASGVAVVNTKKKTTYVERLAISIIISTIGLLAI